MTSARNQPFCRIYNINIGYYDVYRVYPRKLTERNTAIKILKNYFCLIGKSQSISFNQVIENQLETSFKVDENVISDKHVICYIKNEYKPKNFN